MSRPARQTAPAPPPLAEYHHEPDAGAAWQAEAQRVIRHARDALRPYFRPGARDTLPEDEAEELEDQLGYMLATQEGCSRLMVKLNKGAIAAPYPDENAGRKRSHHVGHCTAGAITVQRAFVHLARNPALRAGAAFSGAGCIRVMAALREHALFGQGVMSDRLIDDTACVFVASSKGYIAVRHSANYEQIASLRAPVGDAETRAARERDAASARLFSRPVIAPTLMEMRRRNEAIERIEARANRIDAADKAGRLSELPPPDDNGDSDYCIELFSPQLFVFFAFVARCVHDYALRLRAVHDRVDCVFRPRYARSAVPAARAWLDAAMTRNGHLNTRDFGDAHALLRLGMMHVQTYHRLNPTTCGSPPGPGRALRNASGTEERTLLGDDLSMQVRARGEGLPAGAVDDKGNVVAYDEEAWEVFFANRAFGSSFGLIGRVLLMPYNFRDVHEFVDAERGRVRNCIIYRIENRYVVSVPDLDDYDTRLFAAGSFHEALAIWAHYTRIAPQERTGYWTVAAAILGVPDQI